MPNAHMPSSESDLVWWGFNLLLLVVVAWAKYDLGEIKSDTKKNRELHEATALEIATRNATCEERHRRLDQEIKDIKGRI